MASALYTISLIALVPLAIALLATLATRRMPAGTRALIWKGNVSALLAIYAVQQLPTHWSAWIVPSAMAEPLVALGRAQVAQRSGGGALWLELLVTVYWLGVAMVLLPAWWQLVRRAPGRSRMDARWKPLLERARRQVGIDGNGTQCLSYPGTVPQTWGVLRPRIVLPTYMRSWTDDEIHAVLVHELTHIKHRDPLFVLGSRIMCALYWFNPAVWFVARELERECELACDDAVLSTGVRPSEYADVLATAAECGAHERMTLALALSGSRRATLRARLAAIVNTRRDIRAPTRGAVMAVAGLTMVVSGAMGTVRLVPTRDVLTLLMRDARWESRAFAVIGLAHRADSVAVAREAARQDPNPLVRAWARSALSQHGAAGTEIPVLLTEHP